MRQFILISLFLIPYSLFMFPVSALAQFCTAPGNRPGISTALGCLPYADDTAGTNAGKVLISTVLSWAVAVGGGLAFLLVVFAGFQITTAAGDPKRVQAARELLTAAVSGLIIIVLSILLLNFLGINVLGLGGLGFNL